MIESKNDGTFHFYLIDTNRVRTKDRIRLLKRIKNLIRLGVPRQAQAFFLAQYLEARRVKRHLWWWYRMNKGAFSWYIGVKKKLRLRQLTRKLRIQ